MAVKWIQSAKKSIEKRGTEGSFRRWCQSRGFAQVTTACIQAGLNSKDPAIRKKANLARSFAHMRRRRRRRR